MNSSKYHQNQKMLNLSLLKNQNNGAVMLSTYFSVSKLCEINLDKVYYERKKKETIINCSELLYQLVSEDKKNIVQLIDTYDINSSPKRYLTVQIIVDNIYILDLKCKLTKQSFMDLNKIVAKAIDHSLYGSSKFNRKTILYNYSKKLADTISLKSLSDIYDHVLNFLNANNDIINSDKLVFSNSIKIDDIKLCISWNASGIVKLDCIANGEEILFYFYKTIVSISSMKVALENAIKIKQNSLS